MSFMKIIVYFLRQNMSGLQRQRHDQYLVPLAPVRPYFHSKCEIVFGTVVIGFCFHLDIFKTILVLLLRLASFGSSL
jgi:hypothetical protein